MFGTAPAPKIAIVIGACSGGRVWQMAGLVVAVVAGAGFWVRNAVGAIANEFFEGNLKKVVGCEAYRWV